ncbi:MAG: hypothetical protein EA381_15445 [Planctomycetaceae bacterium]|nr:MAG: hypothetical protein EA381_15445 [Planctomycetaceae bacterium]
MVSEKTNDWNSVLHDVPNSAQDQTETYRGGRGEILMSVESLTFWKVGEKVLRLGTASFAEHLR